MMRMNSLVKEDVHRRIMLGKWEEAEQIIDKIASVRGDVEARAVVEQLDRDDLFLICRNYDESHTTVVSGLMSHMQKRLFINDMYAMAMHKIMIGEGDISSYYNDFVSATYSVVFTEQPSVESVIEFFEEMDSDPSDENEYVDLATKYDYAAAVLAIGWGTILPFLISQYESSIPNEDKLTLEYFISNPDVFVDFAFQWKNEVDSGQIDYHQDAYDDPYVVWFLACMVDADMRDMHLMCENSISILMKILTSWKI